MRLAGRTAAVGMALTMIASAPGAAEKFFPPNYLVLGCEGSELNARIVECKGVEPYNEMTCSIAPITVSKEDAATSQKSRAEFLAAAAKQTDAERTAIIEHACKTLAEPVPFDFGRMSAGARVLSDRAVQHLRALCDCKGKDSECATRAVLPTLEDEKRICRIRSLGRYEDTFTRVAPKRWVHIETPGFGCVASSTQLLEEDPKYSGLWTYTLQEIATSVNPVPKDPICARYKGAHDVCSWRFPLAAALDCDTISLR